MTKRLLSVALATLLTSAVLAGCGQTKTPVGSEKTTLTMGISPGPYSELFTSAIEPILAKEGYTVKHVNFTGLLESDVAINEGAVDFNVDQHTAYMDTFNAQRGADLTPLVRIPTVAAALFSTRHTSLEEVAPHAKVAIPQDPSNASRAYRLLEKAGWIVMKPDANPVLMKRNDIARNIKQINIIEMDSSNIPRTLQDIDYAVIPGSVAYASHVEQRNALVREDLIDNLYLVVAVKAGNDNTQWANAIKHAYLSNDFEQYVATHNDNGVWQLPPKLQPH